MPRLFFVLLCCYLTATATAEQELRQAPITTLAAHGFAVYGKALASEDAGISARVTYTHLNMPDLDALLNGGGTLEVLTSDTSLHPGDIVISEIMWGVDTAHPGEPTDSQWLELYNTTDTDITVPLYFLFSPLQSHTDRQFVRLENGHDSVVLDAISTLHLGKWTLPGRSGRRPFTDLISANRTIDFESNVVPHGSYRESWIATPANGERNIIDNLPYQATPGTMPVDAIFLSALKATPVLSNQLVINEVRNDTSPANHDWVEVKNISRSTIYLMEWSLTCVTGVDAETELASFSDVQLLPEDILVLSANPPYTTPLADGVDLEHLDAPLTGARHLYYVAPDLDLPNTGRFTLLLRENPETIGTAEGIADYAGDGFFTDSPYTDFWPRVGQKRPTDIADFGRVATFGAVGQAWARLRYQRDDGHHREAWEQVGSQGGLGYAPNVDLRTAPGTPGYENTALKTFINTRSSRVLPESYTDGRLVFSEIMADPGADGRSAQWIELYNSSHTEAVSLQGWQLSIENLDKPERVYPNGHLTLRDTVLLPNQTLLLVSRRTRNASNHLSEHRVYDLYRNHRRDLNLSPTAVLLNPEGFLITLSDASGTVADAAGNLIDRRLAWELPVTGQTPFRQSWLRQFGSPYRRELSRYTGTAEPPIEGTKPEGWRVFQAYGRPSTYYGAADDRGTPGERLGSPLPVTLSSFVAKPDSAGQVQIRWTTESEVETAGYHLYRGAEKITHALIPGAGTTSERQVYTFTDTPTDTRHIYHLVEVALDGTQHTLATVRITGDVKPIGKTIQTWGALKKNGESP